jgi:molybdate transport system substrate-binding protein
MSKPVVYAIWLLVVMVCTNATAADIKVFSANAAKLLIQDLLPEFERITGSTVSVTYDEPGAIKQRILAGEKFDLTLLPSGWNQVGSKLATESIGIGHTEFGMAIIATAPKPDTSSIDTLKRTLLESKSIVCPDPKTGSMVGELFARMIEHLGIADEVNKKSRLVSGVLNGTLIVKGEADLAIQLSSDILAVPSVQFLPMPSEFQTTVTLSAAVAKDAPEPEVAHSLLQFLTGPSAVSMLKANGFEPG